MRKVAPNRVTTLPTDPKERKKYPIFSGVLAYFPDAIAEVAHVSWVGNEQHNPGEPLHWARGKSMDQEDTLLRHLMESGGPGTEPGSGRDSDGIRHAAKAAWRSLAKLQLEIEAERDAAPAEKQIERPRPKIKPENFEQRCFNCGETLGAHSGYRCVEPHKGEWK